MDTETYNKIVVPFTKLNPMSDAAAIDLLGEMVEKLPDLDADFVMARNMYRRERQIGCTIRNAYFNTIDALTIEADEW